MGSGGGGGGGGEGGEGGADAACFVHFFAERQQMVLQKTKRWLTR